MHRVRRARAPDVTGEIRRVLPRAVTFFFTAQSEKRTDVCSEVQKQREAARGDWEKTRTREIQSKSADLLRQQDV